MDSAERWKCAVERSKKAANECAAAEKELNEAREELQNTMYGTTETLTRREREVLSLVRKGLQNKEIASELFINISTVKFHVGSLLKKFGKDSRIKL
jgi:DNA-binding NarL/FixJ family response regulator